MFLLFWVCFGLVFLFFLGCFPEERSSSTAVAFAHISSEVFVVTVISDITFNQHRKSGLQMLFVAVLNYLSPNM